MKFLKKYKLGYMEWLLGVLFVLQSVLTAYCNLFLTRANLDTDNAKLFTHIIEMWKSQRLAIPNWSYTTTLEWDCTTVFALPLYGLTGNIYLSCGLSNILLFGLFMGAVFYLFRGKRVLYPLLCANILAVPYHLGMLEYYNMMFFCGSQYVVKVILPLLLVGIFLAMERKQTRGEMGRTVFFLAVYGVFLTISGMSSGIYVAVCGLLPVFLGYFGWKLFRGERVPVMNWVIAGVSLALSLWGRHVNEALFGVMRGEGMTLTNAYTFFDTIGKCFTGMFELFGGISEDGADVVAFSLQGAAALEKICLVLLLFVCGGIALKRCLKKQGDLRTVMLLALFFWNLLILSVTVTRAGSIVFEQRYHLIGMLPLVCVAGSVLLDGLLMWEEGRRLRVFAVGFLALLFLSGESYLEAVRREDPHVGLKELVAHCEDLEADYIYLYNESDNSAICRLLGENATWLCLLDDGAVWAYDFYNGFSGSFMQTEGSVVAIEDELDDLGEERMIAGHRLVQFDRVGTRSLYYFESE